MSDYKRIGPQTLKQQLHDGGELALIDVREQGRFFHRHLLFACCIPLSRLELLIDDSVPRRSTRIVLCDGGAEDGGLATRAAAKLAGFGYRDIAVLDGGVAGWRGAGYECFSGINVPSKAFGEFVERTYATPHIGAAELKAKLDAGEKLTILDSRPMDEFRRMSIPGGIDCPGAELVYRVHQLVGDDHSLVVVNCAGRTRSIIGAQSLLNAALPNPVMALENGTMGWQLAGFELAHGRTEHAPKPRGQALRKAQAGAARVAERFAVRYVDAATVAAWRDEARTLYLLDVRSPEEYRSAHLADARNAPGGQLVQATDEYLAVRNARVVLLDDDGVRATMTASWLVQMGWQEVYVLAGGLGDETLVTGPRPSKVLGLRPGPTLSAGQLQVRLEAKEKESASPVSVLDVSSSLDYRRGHIPGAWWGMRTRLPEALARLPEHHLLVLTSGDGVLAQLAAQDLAALGHPGERRVLEGGNAAWRAAGCALEQGGGRWSVEPDDVWYKPYEHREAVEQAMRDYLSWEVDLVEQIERDGDARFRAF